MSPNVLRSLHHARPFHPFRICLVNGESLEVEHWEKVAISQSGKSIAVAQGTSFAFIDLDRVCCIEVAPAPLDGDRG
jgi:hypothetical protein